MTGKHRDPRTLRLASVFSLAVALVAAAVMLTMKPTAPQGKDPGPTEVILAEAYPDAKPVALARDGYQPMYFVDEKRSVGTAITANGDVQLLLRDGQTQRELRKLPKAQVPEFAGFVAEGERIVWLELTLGTDKQTQSRIWAIDSMTAAPRMLTADTGDIALFDKRDDLVLHDGEVSWVAMAPTETPQTEIRTVSLAGGEVRVDKREGAFSFVGWPWLTTVNLGQSGPIELRNLLTDERNLVAVQPNELMACSPTWCRSVIIGDGQANTVIELLRPTGVGRFRSAFGSVAASMVDVAVLDRYEVYSYAGGRLVLFDIDEMRSIVIATGVGQVVCRGPMLWWSTGDNETLQWNALDMRRLATP